MKKFILLFTLWFAVPVHAGPFDWIKRQIREHPTRTAFVVGTGAATVHFFGLRHCRQGPVENCEAGYGSAWASFGVVTGGNLAAIVVSDSCRKNDGGRFCNVLAYGGSGTQASLGIIQWRNKDNEKVFQSDSFHSLLHH